MSNKPVKKKIPLSELPELVKDAEGFQLSSKGRQALSVAMAMRQTKHGLYSRVPMICKGDKCPSYQVCPLKEYDLVPIGEKCPVEAASVIDIFNGYKNTLDIDPDNTVDLSLLKELTHIEVVLDRCKDRLALEDMIQDVTIGVSEQGREIKQPQMHKANEIYDRNIKRKHEILRLLSSTRKDKEGQGGDFDMAQELSNLLKRKRELEKEQENIVDADFTEDK